MQIDKDHLYRGAALIQVAEHPQFTAINSLRLNGKIVSPAYKINDEIGFYLKYCESPKGKYREYVFNFHKSHLADLAKIAQSNAKTIIGLVCVKDKEICALSYEQLTDLVARRRSKAGYAEDQYIILVTAPKGKRLRAYINPPGVKGKILGKALVIARDRFPKAIFD